MAKVLGMGNALVDIITRIENDSLLEEFGLPKGSMTLVDLDTSNYIQAETTGLSKSKASGGSAANTIHGLAHLGVKTGFVGSVGNDEMGKFFKKDMQVNQIQPILFKTLHVESYTAIPSRHTREPARGGRPTAGQGTST